LFENYQFFIIIINNYIKEKLNNYCKNKNNFNMF